MLQISKNKKHYLCHKLWPIIIFLLILKKIKNKEEKETFIMRGLGLIWKNFINKIQIKLILKATILEKINNNLEKNKK